MPDWQDIAIDLAHVDLPTRSGKVLTIWYRPGAITPRMVHASRRWRDVRYEDMSADEQTEVLDSSSRMLEALVDSWNVDNRGVPVEPTVEGLLDVPFNVQRVFISAIMDDQQAPKAAPQAGEVVESTPPPTAATGAVNTAASSTAGSLAPRLALSPPASPNGTARTPSRHGSASRSSNSPTRRSGGSTAP